MIIVLVILVPFCSTNWQPCQYWYFVF